MTMANTTGAGTVMQIHDVEGRWNVGTGPVVRGNTITDL